jgi:hypothetical protein
MEKVGTSLLPAGRAFASNSVNQGRRDGRDEVPAVLSSLTCLLSPTDYHFSNIQQRNTYAYDISYGCEWRLTLGRRSKLTRP